MKKTFVEPKIELVQFTSDDVMCDESSSIIVFSGRDTTVSDK